MPPMPADLHSPDERPPFVGARAVVTKDVQPWTVVAGNPARVIKQRVLAAPP